MKHNKCVPIIRIKLNEIKEYPKYYLIMEAGLIFFRRSYSLNNYDKIGLKFKILYKEYHQIKKAHTSFSMLNGMTQCYIMGRRCCLETLIRKCSRSV